MVQPGVAGRPAPASRQGCGLTRIDSEIVAGSDSQSGVGAWGEATPNYGTDAARSEQAGQGGDEVDEKNEQIAHRRSVAGRGTLRNHGRNDNSPATGSGVDA